MKSTSAKQAWWHTTLLFNDHSFFFCTFRSIFRQKEKNYFCFRLSEETHFCCCSCCWGCTKSGQEVSVLWAEWIWVLTGSWKSESTFSVQFSSNQYCSIAAAMMRWKWEKEWESKWENERGSSSSNKSSEDQSSSRRSFWRPRQPDSSNHSCSLHRRLRNWQFRCSFGGYFGQIPFSFLHSTFTRTLTSTSLRSTEIYWRTLSSVWLTDSVSRQTI